MKLGRGLRLDEVAEAAEETQRGIDDIVFALFLLHGGFGLLAAAPEDDAIMGIEDEEAYLDDRRRRKGCAGGAGRGRCHRRR